MNLQAHTRRDVVLVDAGLMHFRALIRSTCRLMPIALVMAVGCAGTDEETPHAEVKVVEAYGLTLDESATPQQVVYALLRSIADDFSAAADHDHDKQREALCRTFSLGAYSTIEGRLLRTLGLLDKDAKTDLGDKRDLELYKVIKTWAPITGYYVKSFDETFESMSQKLRVTELAGADTARVFYPVSHDPDERDPDKLENATLFVELAKESVGDKEYWRVARISFTGNKPRSPSTATKPAFS